MTFDTCISPVYISLENKSFRARSQSNSPNKRSISRNFFHLAFVRCVNKYLPEDCKYLWKWDGIHIFELRKIFDSHHVLNWRESFYSYTKQICKKWKRKNLHKFFSSLNCSNACGVFTEKIESAFSYS